MEDQDLPKSIKRPAEEPISLSPKQRELCRRLNDLHSQYGLKALPSQMFEGAFFVSQDALKKNNPDWIAQAANSLREILYPIWGKEDIPLVSEKKKDALVKNGSVRIGPDLVKEIDRIYFSLNDLTHHGCNAKVLTNVSQYTVKDFEVLVSDFEEAMAFALDRQLDVHAEIDRLLALDPSNFDPAILKQF